MDESVKPQPAVAPLIHAATTEPDRNIPPQGAIEFAIQMSAFSPCQSKRGASIFAWHAGSVRILGLGYNHKSKFECDGSDTCKATCRIDAIHAEQMALINAAKAGFIVGMEALHVKTVNGLLVASGGPSCVECSKLMRASGICYTDVHETLGHIPGQFPRILGHEPVGEIVAVAPDVTTRTVGDRVGTAWIQSTCGRCEWCL